MLLPNVVVDASVAGAWSFAEPFSIPAQLVLAAILNHRVIAMAPDRFEEEILRICQKKTLPPPIGASIPPDDAWERFFDIMTSPMSFLRSYELHERAWQLAFATSLTTHDALYLAAAEREGAELWTLDERLAGSLANAYASVHDLRIETFPY